MFYLKRILFISCTLILFTFSGNSYSENEDINEVLESIQKDLKTLEKAVYSDDLSLIKTQSESSDKIDKNSEDVLTRHLLKLSEIEKQFQELTNKFEEINFKLDSNNLIPAIIQDYENNEVLMIAYMSMESLAISIDNGVMHMLSLANIPMIVLFGPTDSDKFAPKIDKIKVIDSKKIYKSKNINTITVHDVYKLI